MIEHSDISIRVYKDPFNPLGRTSVEGTLTRTDVSTVDPKFADRPEIIEAAKSHTRRAIFHWLYHDIIEPLTELESLALLSKDIDPHRVRELRAQIDAIMRGEE